MTLEMWRDEESANACIKYVLDDGGHLDAAVSGLVGRGRHCKDGHGQPIQLREEEEMQESLSQ